MPTTILLVLPLLFAVAFLQLRKRRNLALPPGPRGLPFIGNLLDIPKAYQWVTYAEWGRKYDTDIIHLQVFNTHIVVLNTTGTAAELLDKKSAISSGRPWLTMLSELIGFAEWNAVFMPMTSIWRSIRTQFQHTIGPDNLKQWRVKQLQAARTYIYNMLESPDAWTDHTRHVVGSNILNITYGIQVKPLNDPRVKLAEKANRIAATCTAPGAYLVNVLPILKYVPAWFPGATFRRQALEWREVGDRVAAEPFAYAKQEILAGHPMDAIVDQLLEKSFVKDEKGAAGQVVTEEDIARYTTAIMYGAGADTTVSALETCILGMALHSEVQQRAHEELDQILKLGRLPDFTDINDLPYINAVVKESLRWNVVTPIGVPHLLMEDTVVSGYRIPKGSTIIANVWFMTHDDRVYADPFVFNPDRFLGPNPEPDPTFAFGFGRRVCPGRYLAQETLWIDLASLLAVFDIRPKVNKDGAFEDIGNEHTSDVISHPKPFKCAITPRSNEIARLARANMADVRV